MDALSLIILLMVTTIAGMLFNISLRLGDPKIESFMTLYVFLLLAALAASVITLVYEKMFENREPGFDLTAFFKYLLVPWSFPLIIVIMMTYARTKTGLYFGPELPLVTGDLSRIEDLPWYLTIRGLSYALEISPALLLTVMSHTVVGYAESMFLHVYLPRIIILTAGFSREGELAGVSLTVNLVFGLLHIVWGGWGQVAYAVLAGTWVTFWTQRLMLKGEDGESGVGLGHALHNILVLTSA